MKLTDIKTCHVCSSPRLVDEEVMRNVLECNDCETLHYIEDNQVSYEFTCKINKSIFEHKTERKLDE
jgi:hypothetical protein